MECSTTVGLIANPASARDIRRIVAHGGAVTVHDKVNLLQRLLVGLAAAGTERVVSMADGSGIMARLINLADRPSAAGWPALDFVDQPITRSDRDTTVATRTMVELGVGAIVVLGGDGTNRIVAAESAGVPLVSISTGTNNAFPRPVEPTVAGLAAGLVATNRRVRMAGTYQAKKLVVEYGDRVEEALVDVAVSQADGVGSGAIWDASTISELFLCFAEPHAIGLSAIGGHARPTARQAPTGLALELGLPAPTIVHTPIAPGVVSSVGVQSISVLKPKAPITTRARRGVVSVDGERVFRFGPTDQPTVTLWSEGPVVVDVVTALGYAAEEGILAPGLPATTAKHEAPDHFHDQTPTTSESGKPRSHNAKENQGEGTQPSGSLHRDGPHPTVRVANLAGVPR